MRELRFLLALWKANLQAAIEYRASFITQVLGMILNNALYFIFWIIFFDRFKEVRGWALGDMMLLYGIVAASFGLGTYLFGNALSLAEAVSSGKLDYYLALPRPVLLHVLASRSVASGLGDVIYGLISFAMAGQISPGAAGRFVFGVACGAAVFISFMVLVHSLAFWIGDASQLGGQALNAIVTFAIYPLTLFDGTAKLMLLTVIPAAVIGTLPAQLVRSFSWGAMGAVGLGAAVFVGLALLVFHRGLRRYESGSAIHAQL
jgi:ABC-2 type transport system permease protein